MKLSVVLPGACSLSKKVEILEVPSSSWGFLIWRVGDPGTRVIASPGLCQSHRSVPLTVTVISAPTFSLDNQGRLSHLHIVVFMILCNKNALNLILKAKQMSRANYDVGF